MIKKLETFEYVSFDIFDTLIIRNISKPSRVFDLAEHLYNSEAEKKIISFKQNRMLAERLARKNSASKEVTLKEIYYNLHSYSYVEKERLKRLELEIELKICQLNPEIFKIYEYCIKNKKKILITSDTYLDLQIIKRILEKNGINKYYKLYISSDIKKKKYTGELYNYILEDLNITSREMIHIGDNIKSDYIMAKENKISALPIIHKKLNKNMYSKKEVIFDYMEHYIENNPMLGQSDYFKFGYETIGVLTYGYVTWLIKNLRKNNIKKVYFFSREGQYLKEVFDYLTTKEEFISRYLYVSRRSLIVPALCYCKNLEETTQLRPLGVAKKIFYYLEELGLEPNRYEKQLCEYNISLSDIVNKTNIKIIEPIIKSDLYENAKKEEKLLVEYLKENDIKGKFAIVDIGWTGSMQYALEKILKANNIPYKMSALFLGQRPEMTKFAKDLSKNKGYLFSFYSNSEIQKIAIASCGILELIFLANHGSTEKYKKCDNKIIPIMKKYEYKNCYKQIRDIQLGALQFIKNYQDKGLPVNINRVVAFYRFGRLLKSPSKEFVALFQDITFLDNEKMKLADKTSIKDFKKDFIKSYWKIGFLKRNIKLPLPYFTIYCFIRKIFYEKRK